MEVACPVSGLRPLRSVASLARESLFEHAHPSPGGLCAAAPTPRPRTNGPAVAILWPCRQTLARLYI